MDKAFRLTGNPIQPLLLMFPLGLFTIAIIIDVADLLGGPSILATLAFWHIAAGLAGGVVTITTMAVDAMFRQPATRAPLRVLGALLDSTVLTSFAVIALIRLRTQDRHVDFGLWFVQVLALGAAGFSAWSSGRLDGINRWERTPARSIRG